MAESANGCECDSVSMPGACFCGALLAFCGDCMAGSPLIIKDLDLYLQPLTANRSPTLNLEEPVKSTKSGRLGRCGWVSTCYEWECCG